MSHANCKHPHKRAKGTQTPLPAPKPAEPKKSVAGRVAALLKGKA